ncbi:MAG: hypothetical protein K0S51_968 [Bacillales bacterium]|jgi:hypothetical protein|nr:hypothetical protein [Bacillales bacterium]
MIPQISSTETNIKLPFSFIIFSLVAFIVSQGLFFFGGDYIVNGAYRVPLLWSSAHLLVLGWMLMLAMGAMYQLVPVVFLTPIWSEKLGFIQFFISSIGIVAFSYTLFYEIEHIAYTASIVIIGILLFIFQMYKTINVQKEKNIMTVLVGSALLCLFLTIILGLLLALSLTGHATIDHLPVLYTHILLGLVGWFTLLIFGFSYKMLPMFSLAHGFSMGLSTWVTTSYIFGLIVVSMSFFYNSDFILLVGSILLLIGFALFAYHMNQVIKKRLKKVLDKPFIFSIIAIGFGLLIHFGAVIAILFNRKDLFIVLAYLYLITWVVFSIVGYLYKIVPFLWWTHKYSKLMGKEKVPALKDLMNEPLAIPVFSAFTVGALGVGLAIILGSTTIFQVSQAIFIIATTVFSAIIFNVLRK